MNDKWLFAALGLIAAVGIDVMLTLTVVLLGRRIYRRRHAGT